jgi:NADPH-dependent curcumin reductase
MSAKNRQWVLASRPEGEPRQDTFRLVESDMREPADGEVLLKTLWLSLDPYMRGRISAAKSYARGVEPGEVMVGGTVSEVVESKDPRFAPGDAVLSYSGWQEYQVASGKGLLKLDPKAAPLSTALGVLGMPGMTAYVGLLLIAQPKAGETVAVAAASGAVGAVVGQLAKIKGARAVGIAGGADKGRYLLDELGFDAAIDRRDPQMKEKLAAACPNGIDVYFENVGGDVFDAVFPLFNNFARMPVCGMIAHYNDTELPPGPDKTPRIMRTILTKRLTVRGFLVSDWFAEHMADFQRDMAGWIREGRVKYREDVVEGLEAAPEAFMGLLKGRNFGKLLVRVAR